MTLEVFATPPGQAATPVTACVDLTCVVDFITGEQGTKYHVLVQNFSTKVLTYDLQLATHMVETIVVGDPAGVSGSVQGKASRYYRFAPDVAGRYSIELTLAPPAQTPTSLFLYNEVGVIAEDGFLDFAATHDPNAAARSAALLAAASQYYVKVKNLPDPFVVADTTLVHYVVRVNRL